MCVVCVDESILYIRNGRIYLIFFYLFLEEEEDIKENQPFDFAHW